MSKAIVQDDGKIIIIGSFYSISNYDRNRICRLNIDGSVDTTFNANESFRTNDQIWDLKVDKDGRILLAGTFKIFDKNYKSHYYGLIRLNSDGTRDETFNPDFPNGWSSNAVAINKFGQIVISWSLLNTYRYTLKKINYDGSIDDSFTSFSSITENINQIQFTQDQGILITGGDISNQALIKKINSDGTVNNSFNVTVSLSGNSKCNISNATVDENGDITLSGNFKFCNGIPRNAICKIDSQGNVIEQFNVQIFNNSQVTNHIVLPNGDFRFVGRFSFSEQQDASNISDMMIVDASGNIKNKCLDETGQKNILSIKNILDTHDNKYFIFGNGSYNGVSVYHFKIDSNNKLDPNFNNLRNRFGGVYANHVQEDGKIIIGGDFNFIDKIPQNNIARLDFDGSVDMTFNSNTGTNGPIFVMKEQYDGKIICGGKFTFYNQAYRKGLVRILNDGSIDMEFDPYLEDFAFIYAIAIQDDGKILIKGKDKNEYGKHLIIRLNSNGTLDDTFQKVSSEDVIYSTFDYLLSSMYPMDVQKNGKILTASKRLSSNGSEDSSFSIKGNTSFIAILSDSTLLMRGDLELTEITHEGHDGIHRITYDGSIDQVYGDDNNVQEDRITTILLQEDGEIIVNRENEYGVQATTPVYRMKLDGTIDNSFQANFMIPARSFISNYEDNYILIGGEQNQTGSSDIYPGSPLYRVSLLNRKTQEILIEEVQDTVANNFPITFDLSVSSTSNLEVFAEIINGNAIVNNENIIVNEPGEISFKITQKGNLEYFPAKSIIQKFSVKGSQKIINRLPKEALFNPLNLDFTSTSGLPVDIDILVGNSIIENSIMTPTVPGLIIYKLTQNGNDKYMPVYLIDSIYFKLNQNLTLILPEQHIINKDSVSIHFNSNSQLPIELEIISGEGSFKNGKLYSTIPGNVILEAFQKSNDQYFESVHVIKPIKFIGQQEISISKIENVTYGDPDIEVLYETKYQNSNPISFTSSDNSVIKMDRNNLAITGAGEAIITARKSPSEFYQEAIEEFTISVNKADLLVSGPTLSKEYGEKNPSVKINYLGFVKGDNIDSIQFLPKIQLMADELSNVGTYPIYISDGNDSNYRFRYEFGSLEIRKTALVVEVQDTSILVNESLPKMSLKYFNFKNNDNIYDLTKLPYMDMSNIDSTQVGTYIITASGGDDENYRFEYHSGELIIDNILNIYEIKKIKLKVYPNPGYDKLYINSDDVNKLVIYSLNGTLIYSGRYHDYINIEKLKIGVYTIEMYDKNNDLITKSKFMKF
ncbi:MAG TPA: MBG domain-containing protein [Fulvivirga sp.]|nr:MBG domain-containing protein [Fulvivirga sp.]